MNLGAFAGGAVQGFQSQQRLNQSQQSVDQNQQKLDQDADIQNRGMAINEQNAANQQDAVDRQTAARSEGAAAITKAYSPQQVQTGTTDVDDGNGGTQTVPVMKTVTYRPGDDLATDQALTMKLAGIHAQYSGLSDADLANVTTQYTDLAKTANGKKVDALLAGDTSQLADVVKLAGRDPAGAKLVVNPLDGVYQVTFADGSAPLDLQRLARAKATADTYNGMAASTTSAEGVAKTGSLIADQKSQSNFRDAAAKKETQLIPSEIARNLGAAAKANAGARVANAAISANADAKVTNSLIAASKSYVLADPTVGDGTKPDRVQQAYLLSRGSSLMESEKMNPRQATAAANKEWTDAATQADAWVNSLQISKGDMKAKWGVSDKMALKRLAVNKALSKNAISSVAASQGNLNMPADGEE